MELQSYNITLKRERGTKAACDKSWWQNWTWKWGVTLKQILRWLFEPLRAEAYNPINVLTNVKYFHVFSDNLTIISLLLCSTVRIGLFRDLPSVRSSHLILQAHPAPPRGKDVNHLISKKIKAPYQPHQRSAQLRQLRVCRIAAYSGLHS